MQPTPEMMAPIQAVTRFMATGDDARLGDAFAAAGVVIVENFAPFLFEGPDAVARWLLGFREHVAMDRLSELEWRFGEAQDFARDGDRAYFVLPTTWTGRTHGRAFSEQGGWAFVLQASGEGWRILSYAWAVTSKA